MDTGTLPVGGACDLSAFGVSMRAFEKKHRSAASPSTSTTFLSRNAFSNSASEACTIDRSWAFVYRRRPFAVLYSDLFSRRRFCKASDRGSALRSTVAAVSSNGTLS